MPDSVSSKSRPRYLIVEHGTMICPLSVTFVSLTRSLLGLQKTITSSLVLFNNDNNILVLALLQ